MHGEEAKVNERIAQTEDLRDTFEYRCLSFKTPQTLIPIKK